MVIGIDARVLSRFKTGIGLSLHNIIKELKELDRENKYVFFSPHDFKLPVNSPNFKKHVDHHWSGKIGSLWLQIRLPVLLKEHGIEIFWGHEFVLPLLAPKKVKRIVTIHDLTYKRFPKSMSFFNYLMNRLFIPPSVHSSKLIFVDSLSTKNEVKHFFPRTKDEKIKVLYYASAISKADVDASIRTRYGRYILTVGSLEPRKNISILLDALPFLNQNIKLLIVGASGWKNRELFSIIENHPPLKEQVQIITNADEKLLASLYTCAEVFVYPSRYEGFGLPLLEAMKCGIPVLSSNSSSLPEIAGDAALYFSPDNPRELALNLEKILGDAVLRNDLIRKGFIREKAFTWKKSAETVLKAFNAISGSHQV